MKVQTVLTWVVPVCTAAMLVSGCDRNRNMGAPAPAVERTTGQKMDDKSLNGKVKDALHDNTAFKFPDVEVNTYNGKVQLSGFVTTREQKQQAEDLAKAIVGSGNVENKISVKP
jgi:osmotically-inducible protein OsmY